MAVEKGAYLGHDDIEARVELDVRLGLALLPRRGGLLVVPLPDLMLRLALRLDPGLLVLVHLAHELGVVELQAPLSVLLLLLRLVLVHGRGARRLGGLLEVEADGQAAWVLVLAHLALVRLLQTLELILPLTHHTVHLRTPPEA